MHRAHCFLCVFLIAASSITAFAQMQNKQEMAPPDAVGAPADLAPMATSSPAIIVLPDEPQAQPKTPRVIDRKYLLAMASLAAAEATRFTSRRLVLENEKQAGAPWVGSLPSKPAFVAQTFAIYSAEALVAYEMKKPHAWLPGDKWVRRLWWVYPAVMTQVHFRNAYGSITTKGPGGCTSVEECSAQ